LEGRDSPKTRTTSECPLRDLSPIGQNIFIKQTFFIGLGRERSVLTRFGIFFLKNPSKLKKNSQREGVGV